VQVKGSTLNSEPQWNLNSDIDFLLSSGDEAEVRIVRVNDKGSIPQCVRVLVQGVPAYGLIDSGTDISIVGGSHSIEEA